MVRGNAEVDVGQYTVRSLITGCINYSTVRVASLSYVLSYRNMTSQVRQNFDEACEAAVNRQINMEMYASHVYLSMVRVQGHNSVLDPSHSHLESNVVF